VLWAERCKSEGKKGWEIEQAKGRRGVQATDSTVLGHWSEQNLHGTLPRILSDFCPMTVCA